MKKDYNLYGEILGWVSMKFISCSMLILCLFGFFDLILVQLLTLLTTPLWYRFVQSSLNGLLIFSIFSVSIYLNFVGNVIEVVIPCILTTALLDAFQVWTSYVRSLIIFSQEWLILMWEWRNKMRGGLIFGMKKPAWFLHCTTFFACWFPSLGTHIGFRYNWAFEPQQAQTH